MSEFGALLTECLKSIAATERKKLADLEDELGNGQLGVVRWTIERWRQGGFPDDPKCVEILARECARRAGKNCKWLSHFLIQGRYPDKDKLLKELCPDGEGAVLLRHKMLPVRGEEFLGRKLELESALEVLRNAWPVSAIEGMGGVGKTTLALEVAYACSGQPRGAAASLRWPGFASVIWVSADQRNLTFDDLLNEIALWLDHPSLTRKLVQEKRYLVRDILSRQPILIVIDNYETITDQDIASFIVDIPQGVKVMLTSREGWDLAAPAPKRYYPARIRLGGLGDAEALTLLRKEAERLARSSKHRPTTERARLNAVVTADDPILLPLVKATEGNPKALVLSLGHIADNATPLKTLVKDLYEANDSVASLLDYFFNYAWEHSEDEARALWRVLPFFAGPAQKEALAAAAGLPGRSLYAALEVLQGRYLLDVIEESAGEELHENARYRCHPLVRSYAMRHLHDNEQPNFEQEPHQHGIAQFEPAARDRWVGWYANFLIGLERKDWSIFDILDRRLEKITITRDLPAFNVLNTERENITEAIEWALTHEHPRAPDMVEYIWYYLYITGFWVQCDAFLRRAIEQAKTRAESSLYLHLSSSLGWLILQQGKYAEAHRMLHEVEAKILELDCSEARRSVLLVGTDVLNYLGQLYSIYSGEVNRDLARARKYFMHFLNLASEVNDQPGVLVADYHLAIIDLDEGKPAEAVSSFRRLVTKARDMNWERAEGYCARGLALALLESSQRAEGPLARQEQWAEAEVLLTSAIEIAFRWREPYLRAHVLLGRGYLYKEHGESLKAIEATREALDLYQQLTISAEIERAEQLLHVLQGDAQV